MKHFSTLSLQYVAGLICQYALIVLFGVAIIGKLMEPGTSLEFISAVLNSGDRLSHVVLFATILIEAFLVLSLLLYGNKSWPFYTAAAVLGFFLLLVGYGMYIDLKALCGCFGSIIEKTMVNKYALIRNAAFIILALAVPSLKKNKL